MLICRVHLFNIVWFYIYSEWGHILCPFKNTLEYIYSLPFSSLEINFLLPKNRTFLFVLMSKLVKCGSVACCTSNLVLFRDYKGGNGIHSHEKIQGDK